GAAWRHPRRDPALFPAPVDDRAFYGLDGDRRVDDVQGAGGLARRRADAAGELREVVGGLQVLQRLLPLLAIDQAVDVGDLVVHGAAGVAERNAAIHAASRLAVQRRPVERHEELFPVAQALLGIGVGAILAVDLEKAGGLAHENAPTLDLYSAAST